MDTYNVHIHVKDMCNATSLDTLITVSDGYTCTWIHLINFTCTLNMHALGSRVFMTKSMTSTFLQYTLPGSPPSKQCTSLVTFLAQSCSSSLHWGLLYKYCARYMKQVFATVQCTCSHTIPDASFEQTQLLFQTSKPPNLVLLKDSLSLLSNKAAVIIIN